MSLRPLVVTRDFLRVRDSPKIISRFAPSSIYQIGNNCKKIFSRVGEEVMSYGIIEFGRSRIITQKGETTLTEAGSMRS
jgi:hypothetical protein